MVLQKRLDYEFNGYQAPHIPRAARSARRRCLFKSKAINQQVCPFDLLATVAGRLLLEGKNYPPSVDTSSGKEQPSVVEDSNCREEREENKPIEGSSCHERKFIYTELVSEAPSSKFCLNELPCAQNGASEITTSYGLEKIDSAEKLELHLGITSPTKDVESEDEDRKQVKVDYDNNGTNLSISNTGDMCSSGNVEVWNRKPSPALASVVNNCVKFPICGDHSPHGSFPVHQEGVKLVNSDNDENSSECNENNGTRNKACGPPQRVGDRRIRKTLASKHCYKETPNVKDDERYNADTKRCNCLDRKENLKRQRSIKDYPFKKRKLYEFSSVSNSDEGISSDGICNLRENGTNGSVLRSGLAQPGVSSTPASARGESTSFHSRNHKVKLKIKSFRVPELFIEISETATVGSLKRTVMEAVNEVLGGGLHVGVILQGKKIRDDNKTLLQTGISHDNKMDTLGFALEPSPVQSSIRLCPEDWPVKLLHDSPQPLSRYPPTPSITWNGVQQGSVEAPPNYSGTNNFNNIMESDHDSAASRHDMSTASESKALVPMTTMKPDPLSVVPMRKSKRSESAQRRIRRPFAVAEVEALVQAVEKLGTGRWRDVKLRAFDNAKHRTYVDLKDKWKTLVHTARISPQQRRGEPVPQELLNRVLNAHAFWSQHQAKQQQLKSQPDTCLLL